VVQLLGKGLSILATSALSLDKPLARPFDKLRRDPFDRPFDRLRRSLRMSLGRGFSAGLIPVQALS